MTSDPFCENERIAGPAGPDMESVEQRIGSHDSGVPFPGRMPKTMHWSVPWSDLMMTMFIFFAILYFYQTHSSQIVSGGGDGFTLGASAETVVGIKNGNDYQIPATEQKSMSALYHFSKKTMEADHAKAFASVDLVPDKAVRIVLAGDLLFDTGRADIKPKARASLQSVAHIIRSVPYMVNIVGHTDNVPIRSKQFPSNWELSVIRASQVARFLIDDMQIPGERLFVSGHAYFQPVKPNLSARNRAANRRVEIIFIKERPRGTSESGEAFPVSSRWSSDTTVSEYDRWPWNTF